MYFRYIYKEPDHMIYRLSAVKVMYFYMIIKKRR